jgi:hypothetical protein
MFRADEDEDHCVDIDLLLSAKIQSNSTNSRRRRKLTQAIKMQITVPYLYLVIPLLVGGRGNLSPSVDSIVEEAEAARLPSW